MTEEKLKKLNDMSHDIKILKKMLADISMLRKLNTNCSGGVCIIGEEFCHDSIIRSLCDKLKFAVEEELESLEKKFASN